MLCAGGITATMIVLLLPLSIPGAIGDSRYDMDQPVLRSGSPTGRRVCTHVNSAATVRFSSKYKDFVTELLTKIQLAPMAPGGDYSSLRIGMPCVRRDDGLWLEFGVFRGKTIRMMDAFRSAHGGGIIYGFDSFQGLPEQWQNSARDARRWSSKGAFSLRGRPPFAETNTIKWVRGWYNESLPPFLAAHSGRDLSLVHIDCDLYSSTAS
eukprot:304502-Pleurochrysis_carterae.AAC.2